MKRSFWLDRRTFVTGGTGLVGSWLVQSLVEAKRGCDLPGAGLGTAERAGTLALDRAGEGSARRYPRP